jgi:DNA mismatch repair protein MutL
MAEQLIPVAGHQGRIRLSGGISRPHYTRSAKTHQFFFVNGRIIRDKVLSHALYEAYDTLLMKGRHPIAIFFIELDSSMVDVNVHPAKREVRFRTPQEIHRMVSESVRKALAEGATPGLAREKAYGPGIRKEPAFLAGNETASETASVTGLEERKSQVREAAASYIRRQEGMNYVPPPRPNYASSTPIRTEDSKMIVPLGQIQKSYIVPAISAHLKTIHQQPPHHRHLHTR